MPPPKTNAINDDKETLQTFDLEDLARYTLEGSYSNDASQDMHLFLVGRDDVHEVLKHVLSRVSVSLYLNMFGYDDDELNDVLWSLAENPHVTMFVTLDRSQAGSVHEKAILARDLEQDALVFNTHFVVGQSETHQISHTKGFVADGKVAGEGSTNWSTSGEGTFVVAGTSADQTGHNYKAQNNTQTIITDHDTCARFTAELLAEHVIATKQASARAKAGS